MTGIGRTVFSGDSISTFPVTIVDVIPRARPQGNLILFRAGGSFLEHSGIIAGMSGSPVYIDGRLVGAVAFAYPLLKDPIGGITPIEEMLALRDLPGVPPGERDGIEAGPVRTVEDSPTSPTAIGNDASRAESSPVGAVGDFPELWARFTRQTSPRSGSPELTATERPDAVSNSSPASGLVAMAVPISLEGWAGPAASQLAEEFRKLGFLPVAGGGVAAGEGPNGAGGRFEPGDAIAIPYVTGDASLAAIGTEVARHLQKAKL